MDFAKKKKEKKKKLTIILCQPSNFWKFRDARINESALQFVHILEINAEIKSINKWHQAEK